MNWKTRIFGKKIKGEALEQLLRAINVDPVNALQTQRERWSVEDVYGKYMITPASEGLNVDIYVYRTDFHEIDYTLPIDEELRNDPELKKMFAKDNKITEKHRKHYNVTIPYSVIESRLLGSVK